MRISNNLWGLKGIHFFNLISVEISCLECYWQNPAKPLNYGIFTFTVDDIPGHHQKGLFLILFMHPFGSVQLIIMCV